MQQFLLASKTLCGCGNSLVVQWFGLCAFTAEAVGLILVGEPRSQRSHIGPKLKITLKNKAKKSQNSMWLCEIQNVTLWAVYPEDLGRNSPVGNATVRQASPSEGEDRPTFKMMYLLYRWNFTVYMTYF